MSKLVENYLLQEQVGKGVYGQVYRAIHQKKNAEFAVKVIPKSCFRSNPKLEKLAINEINILSSLKNDYIIKFVETLKTPNNFYFIYEYCNGGTIESLIKKRKFLPESEALIYFKQLLEAFKQLNKNNVMHRDLKPDNIFLSNGKVKLGDFGFCKILQGNMAQTMLGSPIYMAPQILKEEIYTSKADIWSLGVVLFEMLFGFCPFESKSISELIDKLKEMELEIPKHINQISQTTQILLKKMLTKDQFKRIQWIDLFDFVINDKGKIVEYRKQYAIEKLEKCFFDESSSPSGKISFAKKQPKAIAENWHSSTSLSSQKQISSIKYIMENEGQTDVKPLKENSLTHIKMLQSEKKNTENFANKTISFSAQREKSQKTKFKEIHKKWMKTIDILEEWMASSNPINEKMLFLVLSILMGKIEEGIGRYPQWTDILIEEKRSIKDVLGKLNLYRKDMKTKQSQKELLKVWKQEENSWAQKAIREMYLTSEESISVEQILAA